MSYPEPLFPLFRGTGRIAPPTGHYCVSDTIHVVNTEVRGEGAVIEQTDPEKNIFEIGNAWRMGFSGLTFLGGRRQLKLYNGNLDSGLIRLENCKCYGASEVAIDFNTQSTALDIEDCVFLQCMQVLIIRDGGDQTVMRDCWITSHHDMKNMAVIENRGGRLTVENLCGVPSVNGHDQRWIDNYGQWLSCVRCRFGGEGGGFTPVVNFAKPLRYPVGSMVLLEDCLIASVGNHQRQCAVYCEEIPNSLVVRDCNLYTAEMLVRPDIDAATYFTGVKRQMLRFDVENNCNNWAGERPAWLKNPLAPAGDQPPTHGKSETQAALNRAIETLRALPAVNDEPYQYGTHRQQTEPDQYVSINAKDYEWDLGETMEGTSELNSSFLGLAAVDESVILLRRRSSDNSWPHVLIRDVTIDLDKTPILTFKLRDTGNGAAASTALKVLDHESQQLLLLGEFYSDFYTYRAFDLRTLFKATGKRRFDVRFYYLGQAAGHPQKAEIGDFILLDFVRAEAESGRRSP